MLAKHYFSALDSFPQLINDQTPLSSYQQSHPSQLVLKTHVEVHVLSSYRRQVFSLHKCLKVLQIVFFLLDHKIWFALFLKHVVTIFFLQIDETAADH